MDIFDYSGVGCYFAATGCVATLRRSGKFDGKLHLLHGGLSLPLHFELDLPSPSREELQTSLGCLHLWSIANAAIRRLFLLLFQEVSSLVVSKMKSKCQQFSLTLCYVFLSRSQ